MADRLPRDIVLGKLVKNGTNKDSGEGLIELRDQVVRKYSRLPKFFPRK